METRERLLQEGAAPARPAAPNRAGGGTDFDGMPEYKSHLLVVLRFLTNRIAYTHLYCTYTTRGPL